MSESGAPVVIGSPKGAAIYFDTIFALPARRPHVEQLEELLERPDEDIRNVTGQGRDWYDELFDSLARLAQMDEEELREKNEVLHPEGPKFAYAREEALYYVAESCCDEGRGAQLVLTQLPQSRVPAPVDQGALVKLLNMKLVDAETASWQQILEFRRDQQAKRAFMALRNFIFTECADLSRAALEDRLGSLTLSYEAHAEKHGFEQKAAILEVLVRSQAFLKVLAAGAFGAVLGGSAGANPALAAGAPAGLSVAFDVAKGMLVRRRKILEENVFMSEHPLNWVFMARDRLEAG